MGGLIVVIIWDLMFVMVCVVITIMISVVVVDLMVRIVIIKEIELIGGKEFMVIVIKGFIFRTRGVIAMGLGHVMSELVIVIIKSIFVTMRFIVIKVPSTTLIMGVKKEYVDI